MNMKILEYTDSPIALYGLSTETQKAISELKNSNIVGLLDGFMESGTLYGKPIINLQQVINENVRLIVVIARPGSCRAIARRIGDFCKNNNIKLWDADGNDLLIEKKPIYTTEVFESVSKSKMLEIAERYDVISFDLFDTLIMRKVLYLSDIFYNVDMILRKNNIVIEDFPNKRISYEKHLSVSKTPLLEEIYIELLKRENLSIEHAMEFSDLEWKIDFETIIPRYDVIDILKTLIAKNKKVCITSDTYYNRDQIFKILRKAGIDEVSEVFISCEYQMSKTQGLLSKIVEKFETNSVLHIGDNMLADVKSAENCGIYGFHILSSVEMFDKCGCLGLERYLSNYNNRLKTGLIISKLFNSPFLYKKKISINDAVSFGYCLIGAVITDFMFWFYNEIKNKHIRNIWFSARDGYLIKKLYSRLSDANTVYFLTSRIAAIRAGVSSEADIVYVDEMKYSGEVNKQMKVRYGIDTDRIDIQIILDKCRESRINYQKYIDSLEINDGDVVFFDFVSKGTSQFFCQKFINKHFIGLYFVQLPNKQNITPELEIYSYINNEKLQLSSIYKDYYILETILTSPKPSLMDFDEEGKPIYAVESRSKDNINCVMDIQKGIIEFFDDYQKLKDKSDKDFSPEFGETVLSLIHQFEIDDKVTCMNVEDIFFNRYTNLNDLL